MIFSQIRRFGELHAWIILLPLSGILFIPVDTVGFELPKILVLALLSLCAAGALSADAVRRLPGKGFFLLFIAGIALSVLFSVAPVLSLAGAPPRHLGVFAWAVFLLMFLEVASLTSVWKSRAAIVRALLLTNLLVVTEGLLQVLHADPIATVFSSDVFLGRVFSTTGQPDTLAVFILLTLPFAAAWAFSPRASGFARYAGTALTAANLLVLAGTASRSGILGLGMMALLCAPAIVRWLKRLSGRGSWAVILALIVIVAVAGAQGVSTMRERFSHPLEGGRSVGSRTIIWPAVIRMITARPIGYGPETMSLVSPQFIGKDIYKYESFTSTVDRAHNLPLDMLFAFGPLGLLGFAGISVSLILASRRPADDPDHLLLPARLALAGFFVATLFGFPAALPWALFWIIAGLIAGITGDSRASSGDRLYPNVMISALVLCALLETGVAVSEIRGRLLLAQGQQTYAGDRNAGANLLLTASRRAPFDPEVTMRAAESELSLLRTLPSGDPARPRLLDNAALLIAHLQSMTGNRSGMGFALLGWLRAEHRDMQGALAAIAEANRLMPVSPVERRVVAEAFAAYGDGESASKQQDSIIELLPPAFFDRYAELRRIYLKENPWLKGIESTN